MRPTGYVTHPDCSLHDTGWAHPDHQGRLAAIARAVYRDMLTLHEHLGEMEPPPATVDDLLLVHSPEYIERVRRESAESARTGDARPFGAAGRISGRSWDAALAAAGCGIAAVDAVLEGTFRNAFCAVRPPGHDVGVDGSTRYGIFNTAAIAAAHARRRRGIDRVLILDLGAMPGTGTAEIAARDHGTTFATVHQRLDAEPVWPQPALIRRVDPGAGASELLEALRTLVQDLTREAAPDLMILSLGFDLLATDPVGGLSVQPPEAYEISSAVNRLAGEICGGRLVSILEGGYDAPAMAAAVVQHLRALTGLAPV